MFNKTVREKASQSRTPEDSLSPVRACPSVLATLGHWMGAVHGEHGLGRNVVVDF